jgi:hypothetical protein
VEKVRDYDEILAALCAHAGPRQVEQACARILAYEDPDGADPDADRDLQRRELTFSQLGSMLYIRGRLDPEGGAALTTAIDALMRPPTSFDERTAAQRRADALVDLARGALAGNHLPSVGGQRPHIGLLLSPESLVGAVRPEQTSPAPDPPTRSPDVAASSHDLLTAAGVPPSPERPWLNWVGEVSREVAQRLACDSTLWRVVLDRSTGLPLDVGREHRIVPWWIRKALQARDRTCRWPGCDIPGAWTDAHHEIPWWDGGTTDIHHLISLCRLCRCRHNRHYAEQRIMPRSVVKLLWCKVSVVGSAA